MKIGRLSASRFFLLVAVVSIAVNALLILRLRARYEAQLVQQVWPAGPATRTATTDPVNLSEEIILLMGDSRMAEWGVPPLSHGEVLNAGQPGATTAQVRLRLPVLLDAFRPRFVVLQAGINDLKLIGVRPDLGPVIVAQALDNISNMVAQCSQHQCKVIVLETWPVGKPELFRRFVWNEKISDGVVRLNEALRHLHSPTNGVYVVDLFKSAELAPNQKMFRDALHFVPTMYRKLTPALDQEIERERKE
jgi:lysophospholipase L1-like esterase